MVCCPFIPVFPSIIAKTFYTFIPKEAGYVVRFSIGMMIARPFLPPVFLPCLRNIHQPPQAHLLVKQKPNTKSHGKKSFLDSMRKNLPISTQKKEKYTNWVNCINSPPKNPNKKHPNVSSNTKPFWNMLTIWNRNIH